jgi:hypothetical protein
MLPYRVSFHPKVVSMHQLMCWPVVGILEHIFQKLHQLARFDFLLSFPSRIIESTIFPSEVNLLL